MRECVCVRACVRVRVCVYGKLCACFKACLRAFKREEERAGRETDRHGQREREREREREVGGGGGQKEGGKYDNPEKRKVRKSQKKKPCHRQTHRRKGR